jgi:hypothetical protein
VIESTSALIEDGVEKFPWKQISIIDLNHYCIHTIKPFMATVFSIE